MTEFCQDPKDGRTPINAKAQSVSRLPMFRDAYAQRRCIVPVDMQAVTPRPSRLASWCLSVGRLGTRSCGQDYARARWIV